LESEIIEPYGFIYITTNLINGKRYIGQKKFFDAGHTVWKTYLGSGIIIKNAIKKYGKENFTRDIIDIAYSKEEINKKEKQYIKDYNAVSSKDFYNLASGGEGNDCSIYNGHTLQEKEKIHNEISQRVSGKSNPNYGNRWSKEKRLKFGLQLTGKYSGSNNPRARNIICISTGKKFKTGKEAGKYYHANIKNIYECCRHKRKSSGELNGVPLQWMYYDEYLKNTNEEIQDEIDFVNSSKYHNHCKKKVICLNNFKIFNSIKEAEDFYNIFNVSACCIGRIKSSGKLNGEKLHWMFYDDYIKSTQSDKGMSA
jgi:group I intron endonuclease